LPGAALLPALVVLLTVSSFRVPSLAPAGNALLEPLPQALRGAGFDAEGRPMRTSDGSHSCLWHFDSQWSKYLAEAYFGLDGKPCLHKDGYHRWTARYDERGNRIEEAYFGGDEKTPPPPAIFLPGRGPPVVVGPGPALRALGATSPPPRTAAAPH